MNYKFAAIIQARTKSTRFPKKILYKIKGKTILEILIDRLKKSKEIDFILVATTNKKYDDCIVNLSKKNKIDFYRGSENNIFSRVLRSAKKNKIENIVEITSDQPLVDITLMDNMVKYFKKNRLRYLTNYQIPILPKGMFINIINTDFLASLKKQIKSKKEKEHLTYYLLNNFKKLGGVNYKYYNKYSFKNLRLTLDYKEDLEVIKFFYNSLSGKKINLKNIVGLAKKNKNILKINSKYS